MDFKTAKKVFWGTTEAKKVYYGSRLVWENVPVSKDPIPATLSYGGIDISLDYSNFEKIPTGRYILSFDYKNDTSSNIPTDIYIDSRYRAYISVESSMVNGQTYTGDYDMRLGPGQNKVAVTFSFLSKFTLVNDIDYRYIFRLTSSGHRWVAGNITNAILTPA